VLPGTVATWMGHAAAVLRGAWGAVTRRAPPRGARRPAVSALAPRVGPAVAREAAGGLRDDARWHDNERRTADNAALGPAGAEAEALRAAPPRAWAGSGCARGWRRSPRVTVCASVVPRGAVPRRALRGRWGQAAAAHAGRRRGGRALAGQARGRGRGLDDLGRQRAPGFLARAPPSLAWRAGPRGPERSGGRGGEGRTPGPCLEHGLAEGGQGRARGVKRAQGARGLQGEAPAPLSRPAMTLGLDGWHPPPCTRRGRQRQWTHAARPREPARQVAAKGARDKRQGREPRGVSGGAGRAGRPAERRLAHAGHAHAAGPPLPAALAWGDAQGRRHGRHTAQAHRDAASPQRPGDGGKTGTRLRRAARPLRPGDWRGAHRPAAVSAPVWRDACTRLWYGNDQRHQAPGAACLRVRPLVVLEPVLGERVSPQWQSASRWVAARLRHAGRARRAVACVHRVGRRPQGRQRHVSQGRRDRKRLSWHGPGFRAGQHPGQRPYDLLGVHGPSADWWPLLPMAPEEGEPKLFTQ